MKASTHVTLGTGSNDYTGCDSLWLQWGEFFGSHENVLKPEAEFYPFNLLSRGFRKVSR